MSHNDTTVALAAQAILIMRIMCWNVRDPVIGTALSSNELSSLGSGHVPFPNIVLFFSFSKVLAILSTDAIHGTSESEKKNRTRTSAEELG